MSRKRVIVGCLIATLFVLAVVVTIIAYDQKSQVADQYTNVAKNVENTIVKKEENKVNENITSQDNSDTNTVIQDDELDLTGDAYIAADAQDKDGNTITVKTENGKPMMMLFWNLTEENSMELLKDLQTYYDNYKDKVTFSAVAVVDFEQKADVEKFISENKIEVPVVYDSVDGSISKANNVSNVPTLLSINKKGEVINNLISNIDSDVIEANLDIISENF